MFPVPCLGLGVRAGFLTSFVTTALEVSCTCVPSSREHPCETTPCWTKLSQAPMLLGHRGPEESTFRKETCLLFHTEFPEPLPLTCTLCLAPCTALSLTHDWALISLPQNVREDFPGGPVVKNPPAKAGDMGSIPGLGRFHMLQGNSALVTQATELVLWSPRPARTEDCVPGAPALLERVHCFLL